MDDLAALKLQIEWGADEALEDAPVDRLRAGARPPPPHLLPQGEGENSGRGSPLPLAEGGRGEGAAPQRTTAAERALQAAAAAATLEQLRAAIAAFDGCALRDTASNLVFAAGDASASLLLIGEPPNADEDRSGLPFTGPAGDYLDRMLAAIELTRDRLMLTPLIPWRPPGDRPPNPAELALCLPFLHRLIALVAPRRLLLMGLLTARSLVPSTNSRRRPRGEWIDVAVPGSSLTLPALPTFSAAELMRDPNNRRAAWDDLRLLRRTLDEAAEP
ncbi:MAG TPA: uracil-DNA glycosylase [Acetobacteraceae bacterium]|jgi:DNA polymerase